MKLLVINPNSTASMTGTIGAQARGSAAPETEITAVNPEDGPPAIQGKEDGEAALPHLFATFDGAMGDREYDAAIIACFDDTGLWALKERSPVPVVGIGEAAYHVAMLHARRFSVVTTLPVSIPVLEDNLRQYGLAGRCAKVRAANVPVLDLEADPARSRRRIRNELDAALSQDNIGAIILGCAGMADLAEDLRAGIRLPLIDGVRSAVGLCEMLVATNAARR